MKGRKPYREDRLLGLSYQHLQEEARRLKQPIGS